MRALVCIGHSHTETVAAAARASGVALDTINFWHDKAMIHQEGDRVWLDPAVAPRLRPPVYSLVGGAVHQDIGLVLHPRPYDFVWPDRPDLPLEPGFEIVPFAAVRAAMARRTQYYLDIMAAIRQMTPGPVFHLESPPTYGPEQIPADDPGWEMFFGKNAVFSPPFLRLKLWRLHSAIVNAHCASIGVTFIVHPREAVTEDGFLREPFHGTPAHANAAYGALLLAQMQQAASRIETTP